MKKRILYNENARKALQKGMSILAKTVGLTLGPRGRNVILESRLGIPQVTNDGATIVQEIELMDHLENIGVELLRQAASKTNDVAGDGTTTATILAYAIIQHGVKRVEAGLNPMLIKRGIDKAVSFVVDKISEYSRPVETIHDIARIASISAGNDLEMGSVIAEAIKKVGREGIITLEETQSLQTYLDISEGMTINKGLISPHFLSSSGETEVCQSNPLILLTDEKITLAKQELVPILEQVAASQRPLLIIADDIALDALTMLIMNRTRGIVDVVAIRTPGLGDTKRHILEDLACLTGAQVISGDLGLSLAETSLDVLGSAKLVTVSKDKTIIMSESSQDSVRFRCCQLSQQIDSSNNSYEKEKLRNRLSSLMGGAATIKIGAATEAELRYKKLRLEDAINATKAAIDEGIIPGGGAALLHLSQHLDAWADASLLAEELAGVQIVSQALSRPLSMIVENSGSVSQIVVEQIKKARFTVGYDANKGTIVDMYNSGIVDPAKVTRLALQNASSIASIILTTECIIGNHLTAKD